MKPIAVAVLLLALQDGEIDRLVNDLSGPSLESRELAEKKLASLGRAAIPALRAVAADQDPEAAFRARRILKEYDRIDFEKQHDAEARKAMPDLSVKFESWTYREGRVVCTVPNVPLEYDVTFEKADGVEIAVERCSRCSPRLVFVKAAGPITPRIRGVRRWVTAYPIEIENPEEGEIRKVGDFTIRIEWPTVNIVPPAPMRADLLKLTCTSFSFDLKPDAQPLGYGGRRNLVARGCGIRRADPAKTWCDCFDGPQPFDEVKVEQLDLHRVTSPRASCYAVEQVAWFRLTFNKPCEEEVDMKGLVLR